MIASIRHNLASLARFSGRDTRAQFWPYALAVIVVVIMGGMILAMIPVNLQMEHFARAHPEATAVIGSGSPLIIPRAESAELRSAFVALDRGSAIVAALTALLLASAVARRLHDRGRSGLWGLLPLPFLGLSFVSVPAIINIDQVDPRSFLLGFFNNLLYIAALAALVVMLLRDSTPGPNRYGPGPGGAAG